MKQPSFDNWTIIFLLFSGIAFLLSAFFFLKRSGNKTANMLLGVYLLLYALMMVEYVLFWTGYLRLYPHWANISGGFPFLFGPLLLYYFYAVYEKKKTGVSFFYHLSPFTLYLSLIAPYYLSAAAEKLDRNFSSATGYTFLFTPWIEIAVMSVYAFVIAKYIRRQNSIGEVKKWSWLVLFYFSLYILSTTAYYVLVRMPGFKVEWDYFISFIISAGILSTAWFGLAYPAIFAGYTLKESVLSVDTFSAVDQLQRHSGKQKEQAAHKAESHLSAYKKPPLVPELPVQAPEAEQGGPFIKYKNSGLTTAAFQELAKSLAILMDSEFLYRENELTLDLLAQKLNSNKHHLSQVINGHFGMNFFDYINSLRIREACALLKSKSKAELNAIEIAYMVGFNNKVTFTAAFKKFTGSTPSGYRKGAD